MCTEESNLSFALFRCFSSKGIFAVLFKRDQRTVATRYGTVKAIPKFIEFPFCRSQSLPYFHIVVTSVTSSPATFQTVV